MATRTKTLPQPIAVPQSNTDAMRDIKAIGDLQRELARIDSDLNDQISALTAKPRPVLTVFASESSR